MKKTLLILVIILCSLTSYNQNIVRLTIIGKVKEASNLKSPPGNINIFAISTRDSTVRQFGLTDSLGGFSLTVSQTGSYFIIAESTDSYARFPDMVTVDHNGQLDIGTLTLSPKTKELATITIIGDKPVLERKIDRLIFNPQANISTKNLSAQEILNRLPFTTLNPEGEISIRGVAGAQLYINDKPFKLTGGELMNYLQTIPVSSIQHIEIITTPPARYDAEGTAGIINIKLKKDESIGTFYNVKIAYDQTRLPKFNISGDMNIRSKSSFLYISLNTKTGKYYRKEELENYYNVKNKIIFWDQEMIRNRTTSNNAFKVVYDYNFSKKVMAGITVNGTLVTDDMMLKSTSLVSRPSSHIDSILYTDNGVYSKNQTYNINLYTKILTGKKSNELTFDVDYTTFHETQDTKTVTTYFDGYEKVYNNKQDFLSFTPRNINIGSFKADYLLRLSPSSSLSFGSKFSTIRTNNDVLFLNYDDTKLDYIPDTRRSNHFKYTEDNSALYLNYQRTFRSGVEAQLGLRGENIHYTSDTSNTYFKLFPSAALSLPKKNVVYQASYSYRIKRPSFYDMNPFRFYINPFVYAEGNPSLQPSFSHNMELSFTYKRMLSLTLFGILTEHPFMQIPHQDDTYQQFIYNRLNLDKEHTYGISLYYRKSLTPFWELSTSNSLYNQVLQSDIYGVVLNKHQISYQLQLVNAFEISKKHNINCELFVNYQSPGFRGLYDLQKTYNIDFTLSKLFASKILLTLNFLDITNGKISSTKTLFGNINSSFLQNFDTRTFRVSASYKFGKTTLKGRKDRKGSNADELNRL
ncbi:outer membrane beta-barrel family protein [Chitinophaga flava]|uniref:Outer membrane protein beta-barrel domain-containing protein n=1 Tax=Chitinophaga flava TaxID=2259036 RepID=A0A365XUL0_9BACT|nr:outer membrane beta-barrel family protein [Chitinophaga flava]RBL90047.1 hypothetical protein DF182_26615 [Chitinophaga flava]